MLAHASFILSLDLCDHTCLCSAELTIFWEQETLEQGVKEMDQRYKEFLDVKVHANIHVFSLTFYISCHFEHALTSIMLCMCGCKYVVVFVCM
jgi:hypothetical protein